MHVGGGECECTTLRSGDTEVELVGLRRLRIEGRARGGGRGDCILAEYPVQNNGGKKGGRRRMGLD